MIFNTTIAGGSGTGTKFALRPDATLVQTFTYDQKAVSDLGLNIPAYSTSTVQLRAAQSGWQTVTISGGRPFVLLRQLTIPEYSTSTKGSGRQEYFSQIYMYDQALTSCKTLDGTKTATLSTSYVSMGTTRLCYWSNATTFSSNTNSYGCYFDMVNAMPAISGSDDNGWTVKLSLPKMAIRGHDSYLNSTYWGYLTDIRYQLVVKVYKIPFDSVDSTFDGWALQQGITSIQDCVNSSTHTLV